MVRILTGLLRSPTEGPRIAERVSAGCRGARGHKGGLPTVGARLNEAPRCTYAEGIPCHSRSGCPVQNPPGTPGAQAVHDAYWSLLAEDLLIGWFPPLAASLGTRPVFASSVTHSNHDEALPDQIHSPPRDIVCACRDGVSTLRDKLEVGQLQLNILRLSSVSRRKVWLKTSQWHTVCLGCFDRVRLLS